MFSTLHSDSSRFRLHRFRNSLGWQPGEWSCLVSNLHVAVQLLHRFILLLLRSDPLPDRPVSREAELLHPVVHGLRAQRRDVEPHGVELPSAPPAEADDDASVHGERERRALRRAEGPVRPLVGPERQRPDHRRAAVRDRRVVPAHGGQVLVRVAQLDLRTYARTVQTSETQLSCVCHCD